MGLPLFLKSDSLQRGQVPSLRLLFSITGAKTSAQLSFKKDPLITGYDAGDFVQATVDSFLDSTNDIIVSAAFGSTAMGANAFGFIIQCNGQMQRAAGMKFTLETTAGGTPARVERLVQASTSALTDAATSALAVSPAGNIYGRLSGVGDLDAGTAGYIDIEIFFEPK